MTEEPENGGKDHNELAGTPENMANLFGPDVNDLDDTANLPAGRAETRMKPWPDACNPL